MAHSEFSEIVELNGVTTLRIHPHKYQQATLESEAQEIYDLKGWRGGFTSSAPRWAWKEMQRCGPGNAINTGLCVTPTINAAQGGLIPEMERILCTHLGFGRMFRSPRVRIEITERGEQALWGHRQREKMNIVFCYAENPDSFASYTGMWAIGDEIGQKGFKRESKFVLNARLSTFSSQRSKIDGRHMGRQLLGSTVYQWGWLKEAFDEYRAFVWKEWKRLDRATFYERYWSGTLHPRMHFLRFASDLNPTLDPEVLREFRRKMPRWLYDMRHRARFSKPAGIIFEGYVPARHVVKPFNLPDSWPRRCAIDPGSKNFHALLIASDESRARHRHFVYRSYHRIDLDNADHARMLARNEPAISRTIAGQISEDRARRELGAGGLHCEPPEFKDLWPGINNFAAAVKNDEFYVFNEEPDPFNWPDGEILPDGFHFGCKGLQDELETYSRPIDQATGIPDMDADPEDKSKFHWLDCGRYFGTYYFGSVMEPGLPVSGGADAVEKALEQSMPVSGSHDAITHGGWRPQNGDVIHRPATGLRFVG